MIDEMASLDKNEAWDLVALLARKPIRGKWVLRKKMDAKRNMEKYKAWLVEKGYFEVSRIDFGDIFSPISKFTSIRLVLYVVGSFDFEVT